MKTVEITVIRNYYKVATITREVHESLTDYEIELLFGDDLENELAEVSLNSSMDSDEIEVN